jgi:hypothetical protein
MWGYIFSLSKVGYITYMLCDFSLVNYEERVYIYIYILYCTGQPATGIPQINPFGKAVY